jgi:WD40 repeat protein
MFPRCLAIVALACAAVSAVAQQPSEFVSLPTPTKAGSFAISRSGSVAAATCGNSKLLIWSLPAGHLERSIDLPARDVDVFTMSDDGHSIFLGDHHGLATVWDSSTGAVRMEIKFPRYFAAAAFSHDDKLLAIAPMHLPVQIYEMNSQRKVAELPETTGGSEALVFSPDDSMIASADADTAVRIYRASDAKPLATNTDFVLEPFAVAFTRDGKQLIAAGGDKTVAFLDVSTGKTLRKLPRLPEPIFALGVSFDGTSLGAGTLHADDLSAPASIIVWEIASGTIKQQWTPPTQAIGGGWTRDGYFVVATVTAQAIRLYRLR